MEELLRNAWMGWHRVTGAGKLPALLLVALLYLWLGHKREGHKQLLHYSSVMAVCCILPVTAVVLMLYQTRFYDYEWIWSAVPVTIVISYAGTKVLAERWQGFRLGAWKKGLPVTAGLLLVVFLCGTLNGTGMDREGVREQEAEAARLLEMVKTGGGEVCLWAPRDIMEHVRGMDDSIVLPYGRNMWDEALGAYSYDEYPEEIEKMYQWMCIAEESGREDDFYMADVIHEKMNEQGLTTGGCLEAAKKAGVNLLVIPEDINELLLNEIGDFTGIQPERGLGYYFFQIHM